MSPVEYIDAFSTFAVESLGAIRRGEARSSFAERSSTVQNDTAQIQLLTQDAIDNLDALAGQYLYYRFTVQVPGSEYVLVSTNKTQLLFISAFSEFFTFKILTREFWFGHLTLDMENAVKLVDDIKGDDNERKEGEERWAMDSQQQSTFNRALIRSVLNATQIGMNQFAFCEELTRNWLSVGFNFGERQLISAKSYYCCTSNNKCGYENQKMVLSLVHLVFFLFKFAFALVFLKFVVRKRKFFFMPREHAIHVTNIYYNPPFWVANFFPKKKWAYDIRNWVFLNIVTVILAVFALNILHAMIPVNFQDDQRSFIIINPSEFIENVKIGNTTWWGLWSYGLIVLPLTIVIVPITMCIKLCSRKTSRKEVRLQKFVQKGVDSFDDDQDIPVPFASKIVQNIILLVMGVLKFFLCTVLSLLMTIAVIFFLLRAYDLYEYNDIFVFSHGFVLWVIGTYFLFTTKTTKLFSKFSDWIFDRIRGKQRAAEQDNAQLLNAPLLESEGGASPTTGAITAPLQGATFSPVAEILFMLRFFIAYEIPSLFFETVWFGFSFFAAFLAASLVCRFIWSQLLLFILYPDEIEVGAYILTILGTMGKFVLDLSNPHAKIRATLLNSKPLVSLSYAKRWNEYVMTLKQEDIENKHDVDEAPKYFVPLTWEKFFWICDQVKIDYFIYKIIGRAGFTIFVISIFFMGFVVFGEQASQQFSDILKLAALSLLPLLPRVLQVLEGKDEVEEATHDIRYRSAVFGVEYGNAPATLDSMESLKAGKAGLSPVLAIVKPVPPPPSQNQKKLSAAPRVPSSDSGDDDTELEDVADSLTQSEIQMIKQEIASKTQRQV